MAVGLMLSCTVIVEVQVLNVAVYIDYRQGNRVGTDIRTSKVVII